MDDAFGESAAFECTECGREIQPGEKMWSVTVNVEVFEDDALTVLDSEAVHVLCESCAAGRDLKAVRLPAAGA